MPLSKPVQDRKPSENNDLYTLRSRLDKSSRASLQLFLRITWCPNFVSVTGETPLLSEQSPL